MLACSPERIFRIGNILANASIDKLSFIVWLIHKEGHADPPPSQK